LLRFASVARSSRLNLRESKTESALLSVALEDAIGKLKAQERATAARAAASERLSSEIVASITSGLLVVDGAGPLPIVTPAARRILALPDLDAGGDARPLLAAMPTLWELIDHGLKMASPLARQTIRLDSGDAPSYLGVSISPLPGATGAPHSVVCLF